MALTNRFLMGGVSLSLVFAIGFVMQNGADPVQRDGDARSVALAAAPDRIALDKITLTVGGPSDVPDLPAATPFEEDPVMRVASAPVLEGPSALDQPLLELPARQCDPVLSLTLQPAAMVSLQLDAPCLPHHRVTFHHNGMMFTHLTDADGQLQITAPALAESAVFIADFGNGDGVVGHLSVPELAEIERAAAQWRGDLGIELHAREFGADYGTSGHIWAETPGDVARGGFLTRLGDAELAEGYRAEVYTYPRSVAAQDGAIQLSVEAQVTAANCNRDIQAESLQRSGDGALTVRELSLSMPDCAFVGDFLLLKNLLQDLKIAAK